MCFCSHLNFVFENVVSNKASHDNLCKLSKTLTMSPVVKGSKDILGMFSLLTYAEILHEVLVVEYSVK